MTKKNENFKLLELSNSWIGIVPKLYGKPECQASKNFDKHGAAATAE
jgi:hypothetical protein